MASREMQFGWIAFVLAGAVASAQVALVPQSATPVTSEDRAKMDRFVGAWQPARNPPDGLTVEYPYPTSDVMWLDHLQPWAKAWYDATEWDVDDTGAVCKRDGLFRHGINTGFGVTFVRSKDKLINLGDAEEMGPLDIFMNSPHPADLLPTWNGDSRAHFEGDMLVIDTIGFNDKSWVNSDRGIHTEELHLIEFLTLHHNGDYLMDRIIVDDRKAYTTPLTYTRVYQRAGAAAMGAPPAALAYDTGAAGAGVPGAPGAARAGQGRGAGGPGAERGEREDVCNQTVIGRDPWRRKREAILADHQEQLDSFVKQALAKDSAIK